MPVSDTARTQNGRNERDKEVEVQKNQKEEVRKGSEARHTEKEEFRKEEKESHTESQNHKPKERELPHVPPRAERERERERIPEARQTKTEREKSPVRGKPEPAPQASKDRPRSPVRAREGLKPTIETTPTRSPLTLTRTKSTPNLPVIEEPPESEEKTEAELMLDALLNMAQANDIYHLFGIDATTHIDEIGKRRRQLTQQLHPDNFVKGSEEWNEAQQRMARVNQAYNNVLRKDVARALYDKIAMYRQSYAKLVRKVNNFYFFVC